MNKEIELKEENNLLVEPSMVENQTQNDHDLVENQKSNDKDEPVAPKESWKELRDKANKADQLQKERDEYLNILHKIEEEARLYQAQTQKLVQQHKEDDFDINNLDDDEVLTARELKRVLTKEQQRLKKLEEDITLQQKYSQEASIEVELKSKYSDFYDVLNHENIAQLREMRPGLAKTLNMNPDMREKAIQTYQAIKDLGIYNADQMQENINAQKNNSKPRSINSISPQTGNSPLSQANAFANGLTPELKKALYKEMREKAGSY